MIDIKRTNTIPFDFKERRIKITTVQLTQTKFSIAHKHPLPLPLFSVRYCHSPPPRHAPPGPLVLTGYGLAVEAYAEDVIGRFLRLEVDTEPGVTLRLHVVGYVPAVDRYDDFQVTGTRLAGVDCRRGREGKR